MSKEAPRKFHTIHIRNVPHALYERMWNLKKARKAKSWAHLMDILTEEFVVEIEELDWL